MIDKTIAFFVLIIAAVLNLPTLFKFIRAMFEIKKEYNQENKEEDRDDSK